VANLEEIRRILSSGEFDNLIGRSEDDQLEFKKSPYQLEDKRQKAELAKDVSSMANVRGGIILIGVETHQDPALSFEVATRIRSLGEALRCDNGARRFWQGDRYSTRLF
jgi:predicted HTH transcriptional regulator